MAQAGFLSVGIHCGIFNVCEIRGQLLDAYDNSFDQDCSTGTFAIM